MKLLRKQFVSETGRIDSVDPMLRHDAYSPEGWALERRNFNHVVPDFRYLAYHQSDAICMTTDRVFSITIKLKEAFKIFCEPVCWIWGHRRR